MTAGRAVPRLRVIQNGRELESVLPSLLDLHDFREGARTGRLPSREHPALREELLALAKRPSELHAGVVERNGQVVAGHVARTSDGMLHVLLAARSPVRQDLVSAEAYLTALADSGAAGVSRIKLGADAQALAAVPPEPQTATMATGPSLRARLSSARWTAQNWLWSDTALVLCRVSAGEVRRRAAVEPMAENRIADLLDYEPGSREGMGRQQMLSTWLQRLEAGFSVFTVADESLLLHSSWLRFGSGGLPLDTHFAIPLPGDAAYLFDDFTDVRARGRGLHLRGIEHRLQVGAAAPGIEWLIISALASNEASLRNIVRAGMRPFSTIHKRSRMGTDRQWQTEIR